MGGRRERSVEHLMAVVALMVVVVVAVVAVYLIVPGVQSKSAASASAGERKTKCIARVVAFKAEPGYVFMDVWSSCNATVDAVYFLDPNTNDLLAAAHLYPPVELKAGTINRVVVPLIELGINVTKLHYIRVALGTVTGVTLYSMNVVNPYLVFKTAVDRSWLVLLADRCDGSVDPYQFDAKCTQWVFFNYVTGDYIYYAYDDQGNLHGPYTGKAPILKGVEEYVVQCDWCTWQNRPVDSPIVIVYNPTKGVEDWKFVWYTPNPDKDVDLGTCYKNVFDLPAVTTDSSKVVYDMLIFWEDQWNPYTQPDLDDWKDHVVRITIFANATARIQVYVAKGAYLHVFAHRSSTEYARNFPLLLCPDVTCPGFCSSNPTDKYDYCKPHDAKWFDRIELASEQPSDNPCGELCYVYLYKPTDRVWTVQLG